MNSYQPMTVSRHSSVDERKAALYQIYQQVLERQPYIFERKRLEKAEKDFLKDKIGVRRFLKILGQSEVYLDSFYHNSSNMKFLELSLKHFLGRAPKDQEEVKFYCDILMYKGVEQMITAMLDSDEYRKIFGCFTVPHAQAPDYYYSPKSYIQSQLLNQEQVAQRGRSLPTIYWDILGLNCDAGVCRHPEADEDIPSNLPQAELTELLQLLRSGQPDQVVAALSPQQKALLRQAISQ